MSDDIELVTVKLPADMVRTTFTFPDETHRPTGYMLRKAIRRYNDPPPEPIQPGNWVTWVPDQDPTAVSRVIKITEYSFWVVGQKGTPISLDKENHQLKRAERPAWADNPPEGMWPGLVAP